MVAGTGAVTAVLQRSVSDVGINVSAKKATNICNTNSSLTKEVTWKFVLALKEGIGSKLQKFSLPNKVNNNCDS